MKSVHDVTAPSVAVMPISNPAVYWAPDMNRLPLKLLVNYLT